MTKYVITGASTYGVKNMGDDAMLACMVQSLRRADPGCEIVFLCRHPDADYDAEFGFQSLKNLDHDTRAASEGRFFMGLNHGDSTLGLEQIRREIETADLLIIGGNSFMEVSENSFLRGVSSYSATLGTLAKFCGTPFALFGVNVVDPIRSEVTRQHAHFLVGNSICTTVRERSAWDYLNDLGVDMGRVAISGDPAFGMEVSDRSLDEVAGTAGVETGFLSQDKSPLVGIGFRHEYWVGDEAKFEQHASEIASAIDEILDEINGRVLFIPNCTYTLAHPWQDDRKTHRDIARRMRRQDRLVNIEADLSVFDTFSLFNAVDMHISNRRHSCIFAAMNQKPFVALSVSPTGHMQPFLSELGVPGQLVNSRNMRELIAKAQSTWAGRQQLVAQTAAFLPAIQDAARNNIPLILKALQ